MMKINIQQETLEFFAIVRWYDSASCLRKENIYDKCVILIGKSDTSNWKLTKLVAESKSPLYVNTELSQLNTNWDNFLKC